MKFFLITFLTLINIAWGQTDNVVITKVICHYPESKLEIYRSRKKKFQNLKGTFRNLVHLKSTMKIIASDGGYKFFNYQLTEKDGEKYLLLNFELKPIIRDIKISSKRVHIEEDLLESINIRKNYFFDATSIDAQILLLKKKIDGMGFPYSQIILEKDVFNDSVDLRIKVNEGNPRIFKKINVVTDSYFVRKFLENKFISLYNQPFDFTKFKSALDEAEKDLFNYGYYLINIDLVPKGDKDRVFLELKISNDKLFAFNIKGVNPSERDAFLNVVKNLFRQFKKPLTKQILKQGILEDLNKKGFFFSEVHTSQTEFTNKFREKVKSYELIIRKGHKILLDKIEFFGNIFFDTKQLKKFYDEQAFELASNNFLDNEYIDFFRDYIRNEYIKRGFLQVKVDEPEVKINKTKKKYCNSIFNYRR